MIARKLAGVNSQERAAAAQRLESLNADDRREVIRELVSGMKASRRTILALGAALPLMHLAIIVFRLHNSLAFVMLAAEIAVSLIWFCYTFFGPYLRQRDALEQAIRPMSTSSSVVGLLIEATGFYPHYTASMQEALEQAVMQTGGGEEGIITREQARGLADRIVRKWDYACQDERSLSPEVYEVQIRAEITMVRLLAAVGSAPEMGELERFTRRRGENERQKRVRAIILEVLPGWKARLRGQEISASMLRSAAKPEDTSSLLRAAIEAAPSSPQELLRSGNNPGKALLD